MVSILAALGSAIAASISAAGALTLSRNQSRAELGAALLQIAEILNTPEARAQRRRLYGLRRENFANWSRKDRDAVDGLMAHFDLVSTLIEGGQVDRKLFLRLYGDVFFKVIYQAAPYGVSEIAHRGPQFLLPSRRVAQLLGSTWQHESLAGAFPTEIGFPSYPHLAFTYDAYLSDAHVERFLVKPAR
ncbi:hypothetical protein [Antiquaquibacter soli]|uniref:Uncharacterized protein n=1 Tax=Antiquaquibacter soli TaxID=3064523 RepID=A0ABT9BRM4_9MICO|nr:hypothetical protein [Protaetiibacter sp. WY-16]MDO7882446.1 hypothetical protein [Protaetiibacter sp. WY-16]